MPHVATVANDDPYDTPRDEGSLRPAPLSQVTARTIPVIASALFLLRRLRTLVRWTVISIFMAVALSPVLNVVQRGRMPRTIAIPIVYLALILILTVLGGLGIGPLVNQSLQPFLAVLAGDDLLGILGGEWLAPRRRPLPSSAFVQRSACP